MFGKMFRRTSETNRRPDIFGEPPEAPSTIHAVPVDSAPADDNQPKGTAIMSLSLSLTARQARNYTQRAANPAVPAVKDAIEHALSESWGGNVNFEVTVEEAREFVRKADRPTLIDRALTLKDVIEKALSEVEPSTVTVSFEVPVEAAVETFKSGDVEPLIGALGDDDEIVAKVKAALDAAGVSTAKSEDEKAKDKATRERYLGVTGSTAQRKVLALAQTGRYGDLESYLNGEDIEVNI